MELSDWIPALTSSVVLTIGGVLLAPLYKAALEKGLQHRLDQRLEEMRSKLRTEEESYKQALRRQEETINALRSGALSGMVSRNTMLDKRKLEAVERLWAAVSDLAPHYGLAKMTEPLNFETLLEASEWSKPDSEKIREFAEMMLNSAGLLDWKFDRTPDRERPFLTPMAWALFSAYRSALSYPLARMNVIRTGAGKNLLADPKPVLDVIAAALPDKTEFIAKYGYSQLVQLLDVLQERILAQLQSDISGNGTDLISVSQSAGIIKAAEAAAALMQPSEAPQSS